MRTLRRVARARPVRDRKAVQKGYEFEVEGRVIAHDIPRKSAKRPSRSISPPCYVTDQSRDEEDFEDSTDTDPLQAAAIVASTECLKASKEVPVRRTSSRGKRRKNSMGSVKSTVDDSQASIQVVDAPKQMEPEKGDNSGDNDLIGATIVVVDDANDDDYVPPRARKRTASPDLSVSTRHRSKRAKVKDEREDILRLTRHSISSAKFSARKQQAVTHPEDTASAIPTDEIAETSSIPQPEHVPDRGTVVHERKSMSADLRNHQPVKATESGHKEINLNALHALSVSLCISNEMLPSPRFPHFQWLYGKVWLDEDERTLQLGHGTVALSQSYVEEHLGAEMRLWQAMVHLFHCLPHALFRYGLKIDKATATGGEIDFWSKVRSAMPKDLVDELRKLLPHPVWDGRIDLLRYALQLAVFHRVKHHIRPLGAAVDIVNIGGDIYKAIETLRSERSAAEADAMLGDYHYEMLMRAGAGADKDIKALDGSLRAFIKPEEATTTQERLLFLLRASDVKAVREALDAMTHLGQPKWRPCIEYRERYEKNISAPASVGDQKPDCKTFLDWKVHCCMAEEREKAIRTKMRNNAAPDRLLDMRETDAIPWYYLSKRVSQEQKDVLSGVVYPPWEKQLPVKPESLINS